MPDIIPPSTDTPATTRTVIGPDGSIYMAGPNSRYNADPTQIPAVNPLPPLRPAGYQQWTPPPEPNPVPDIAQFQQQAQDEYRSGRPYAQALSGATAATRFAGVSGFDRDVASGMSKTEAWQKWAPLMLFNPIGSTAGAQSQFARSLAPRPRQVRVAGGQIYDVGGQGQAVPITPPPSPKAGQRAPIDRGAEMVMAARIKTAQNEISDLSKQIRDDPTSPDVPLWRQRVAQLETSMRAIPLEYSMESPQPGASVPQPTVGAPPTAQAPAAASPVPTAAAPAQAQGDGSWGSPAPSMAPLPLPKSRKQLVVGKSYKLPQGVYRWDGSHFKRVTGATEEANAQ